MFITNTKVIKVMAANDSGNLSWGMPNSSRFDGFSGPVAVAIRGNRARPGSGLTGVREVRGHAIDIDGRHDA